MHCVKPFARSGARARSRPSPAGRCRAARRSGANSLDQRERRGPSCATRDVVAAASLSASASSSARVVVVVDDEHAPAGRRAGAARRALSRRRLRGCRLDGSGSRTVNSLPRPTPVAVRPTPCRRAARPGCARCARPRPRPPSRGRAPGVPCTNSSKTRGSSSRRDADAVVAHAEHRPSPPRRAARDRDRAAAARRVLARRWSAGSRPPAPAAPDRRRPQAVRGTSISSWCARCSSSGLGDLDRLRDHARASSTRCALELDLAARDARDVEQVVDQAHQVARPGAR